MTRIFYAASSRQEYCVRGGVHRARETPSHTETRTAITFIFAKQAMLRPVQAIALQHNNLKPAPLHTHLQLNALTKTCNCTVGQS